MSSKEMLNNSNEPELPSDESAPRSSHCLSSLVEAIETVELWADMWADDQSEIEEVSPCDIEERKVIKAVQQVLKAIPGPEDYVAWLRWNGHTFVACDSDSEGAFKVCRHPF
ncbi:hypothetical protein [Crateriforma spongiae]|uniref:hypothetical protein n=1 Tax=Crateriforma spongiae TaxID=2724528 RepID=UPI0039AED082